MNRMLVVGLTLSLAACAPPDFSGSWSGTVADYAPCDDGSVVNFTKATSDVVSQSGSTLSISGNDICGVWTATVRGDVAQVDGAVCPTVLDNGYLITQSLTGGTFHLNGDSLDVNVTTSFAYNGPTVGSCNGTITGTMTR